MAGNGNSNECTLSTLDTLTEDMHTQRQIIASSYVPYTTHNPLDSEMLEFKIYSKGEYFDLNKTEMELEFKITRADGTNLQEADRVGVINYISNTLFETVNVSMNNTPVSHSGSNYAQRAILEMLLNYGRDAVESWAQCGLFYKDTPGQMNNVNPNPPDVDNAPAPVNTGLRERARWSNGSRVVETRGRLHLDVFNQPKVLVNGVELILRFHRNKDEYVLLSSTPNEAFKVQITKAVLWMKKLTPSKSLVEKYNGIQINYPISRCVLREFQVAQGRASWQPPNFHSGTLPTKFVMGFVREQAKIGSYTLNPFNYEHVGVTELVIRIDGNQVDTKAISLDYDNDRYLAGYHTLWRATNKKNHDEGSVISREDYKGGYTLYMVDLTPTCCDGQYRDPSKEGTIEIEFTFARPTAHVMTLQVYLEFDNNITINKGKLVVTNFE